MKETIAKTGVVIGKLFVGLIAFAVLGTAANYADSFTGIEISSCGGHGNTWLGENVFALGYGMKTPNDYYSAGVMFIPGRLHVESYRCEQKD